MVHGGPGDGAAAARTSRACAAKASPSSATTPPPTTARPARSTLLTGLYTHQTGCMITGGSTLDPGFPTWGTMLREQGYDELVVRQVAPDRTATTTGASLQDAGALERYGFAGGTFPSPDGGPGQGWRVDPQIADQFEEWFAEERRAGQPWCTTVSFVNPHDIAWWWRWSERIAGRGASRPRACTRPAAELRDAGKCSKRTASRCCSARCSRPRAASFGAVPLERPRSRSRRGCRSWTSTSSSSTPSTIRSDASCARSRAAPRSPRTRSSCSPPTTASTAPRTGCAARAAGAYEEAIRVPLIVKDPRGKLTAAPRAPRTQLSSSVDVAPLLLTHRDRLGRLAQGPALRAPRRRAPTSPAIARQPARARDGATCCTPPTRSSRSSRSRTTPRTRRCTWSRCGPPNAKYVTYCNWRPGKIAPEPRGQEHELYDYRTRGGRLELRQRRRPQPPGAGAARDARRGRCATSCARPLPRHLRTTRTRRLRELLPDRDQSRARRHRGPPATRCEGESGPLSPFGGRRHGTLERLRCGPRASAQRRARRRGPPAAGDLGGALRSPAPSGLRRSAPAPRSPSVLPGGAERAHRDVGAGRASRGSSSRSPAAARVSTGARRFAGGTRQHLPGADVGGAVPARLDGRAAAGPACTAIAGAAVGCPLHGER